jgi:hypothetical protein
MHLLESSHQHRPVFIQLPIGGATKRHCRLRAPESYADRQAVCNVRALRRHGTGRMFSEARVSNLGKLQTVDIDLLDEPGMVNRLAHNVRDAYVDVDELKSRLLTVSMDLTMFEPIVFSEDEIATLVTLEVDAKLPTAAPDGRPPQLSVQRSEFAEILAGHAVIQALGANLPARRTRSKEIPDQQSRGADLLGLLDCRGTLPELLVGEVKATLDSTSPPSVVTDMAHKLRTLLGDFRLMQQELMWLRDNADEPNRQNVITLQLKHALKQPIAIRALPILVRQNAGQNDCGCFADDDALGSPVPVTFLRVIVTGDIASLASKVYKRARDLEP